MRMNFQKAISDAIGSLVHTQLILRTLDKHLILQLNRAINGYSLVQVVCQPLSSHLTPSADLLSTLSIKYPYVI